MSQSRTRCAALDMNGKQCSARRTRWQQYHGDNEIFYEGPIPDWVRVPLCAKHSKPSNPKKREGTGDGD